MSDSNARAPGGTNCFRGSADKPLRQSSRIWRNDGDSNSGVVRQARPSHFQCAPFGLSGIIPGKVVLPGTADMAEAAGVEPAHRGLPGLSAFKAGALPLCQTSRQTNNWRSMLDSNQRANSRRPRLSKPAPWTTRPMLLNWCPQRCSRARPAAYRAAALPLSYMGEVSSPSIRLCPRAIGRMAAAGFYRCTTGATWCTWRPCPTQGSIEGGIAWAHPN